jgi:pimeloyl-ACP methyl ester carboxylesterase
VTIVPDAGHHVHAEMPDVTAAAVLTFLARA